MFVLLSEPACRVSVYDADSSLSLLRTTALDDLDESLLDYYPRL